MNMTQIAVAVFNDRATETARAAALAGARMRPVVAAALSNPPDAPRVWPFPTWKGQPYKPMPVPLDKLPPAPF